jgi:GDP-4-dehydro-6-deoxy-D-mannose reductase
VTSATGWQGRRPLVIGATGFLGAHLLRSLAAAGAEAHGMARHSVQENDTPCVLHRGDLLDRNVVEAIIRAVRPTHVFNAAGLLKPAPDDPQALWRVHVDGTRILFETLHAAGLRPTVLIASSAAVYGATAELPVGEEVVLEPRSPYGRSKLAQETVAFDAMRELGVPVICGRGFNIVGAGLSPRLLASRVARDIVRAEQGGDAVLRVGNLDQRRDFIDVRDAVRAFCALAAGAAAGRAYNVCAGRSVPVRTCVDRLVAQACVPIKLEIDVARVGDVEDSYGSVSRLADVIEWKNLIPLERSLDDLLEDWRRRLSPEEDSAA